MVDSRLKRLAEITAPGQTKGWIKELTLPPWEGRDKKQHKTHMSMDSQIDSKTAATSKRKRSLKQTKFGVDLNAKQIQEIQEGDLRAELNGRKTVAISKVVPME